MSQERLNGVVVQLVRIPACHAGGRGFESRPYRRGESNIAIQKLSFLIAIFVLYTIAFIVPIVFIVTIVNESIILRKSGKRTASVGAYGYGEADGSVSSHTDRISQSRQ